LGIDYCEFVVIWADCGALRETRGGQHDCQ
jgi:hypothetical protein